ncbi:MAG: pantoate--beta-alanine ligase, partial [Pseudomonadota bacterium]
FSVVKPDVSSRPTRPTLSRRFSFCRDADGLALSSRNAYLSDAERSTAPRLHETLVAARQDMTAGRAAKDIENQATERLLDAGFDAVDYVAIRRADDLSALPDDPHRTGCDARILAAAHLGGTRLIDNIAVQL